MVDSFDPTAYAGPTECVAALSQQGIRVGHRLAARIFALGHRRIRFSLAILEEAGEGGPIQQALLHPDWLSLPDRPDPSALQALLPDGLARLVESEQVWHVLTPDEVDAQQHLVKAGPGAGPVSVLPGVLGTDPGRFSGLLFDRKRVEEATLQLLDGEDPVELVEQFRYLFRALLSTAQDPTPLLVSALSRGKLELSREVARQVHEHLDREFGRALDDVFSQHSGRIRDGLRRLLKRPDGEWGPIVLTVLLPSLGNLLELGQSEAVFQALPEMGRRLLAGGVDWPRLESFLEELLRDLTALQTPERSTLAQFLVALQEPYPALLDYLESRLRGTLDPDAQAYFLYVLSRLELPEATLEQCREQVVELVCRHGLDTAIRERLRLTIAALGSEPLARLCSAELREALEEPQRVWLVHLWARLREDAQSLPPEELFLDLVRDELIRGSRAFLLALVRTEQLLLRALVDHLVATPLGAARNSLVSFLSAEAYRLEDPDDEAVYRLLGHFGEEVVLAALARLREETALDSGASSTRLEWFARILLEADRAGAVSEQTVREVMERVQDLRLFRPKALPALWTGLGYLGESPRLTQAQREWVVERVQEDLERFPEVRIQALVRVHRSAQSGLRTAIEERLRSILSESEPNRPVLTAALNALLTMVSDPQGFPEQAEALVADLCRTVLRRGREVNLESVMRKALSYATEGDGIRTPEAWGRDDRDLATRILGRLACHPKTPERLHRMLTVRLFSFLEDWLEAIASGHNLYGSRDTVLWEIVVEAILTRVEPWTIELASNTGLHLLQLHRRSPGHLALARRENVQRFVFTLIRLDWGARLELSGVPLDLPQALLDLLFELSGAADLESPVSVYFLKELAGLPLREPLPARVRTYLKRVDT